MLLRSNFKFLLTANILYYSVVNRDISFLPHNLDITYLIVYLKSVWKVPSFKALIITKTLSK